MKVIVTGSAGFIGQRVCSLLGERGYGVIECDLGENVLKFCPPRADAVIHLAANKYATDGEVNPYTVARFNIDATAAVLDWAPRVVLASTCKAANPITCYGASKLICERMVLNYGGTVLRLVNVLGSTGSVTDIWDAVPEDEPLPVTSCYRLFITPEDAVRLLVDALDLPPGRYGPRAATGHHMDTVAAIAHPKRPRKRVPLRVGDRPKERLVGEYERCEPHGDFLRILDAWEAA